MVYSRSLLGGQQLNSMIKTWPNFFMNVINFNLVPVAFRQSISYGRPVSNWPNSTKDSMRSMSRFMVHGRLRAALRVIET